MVVYALFYRKASCWDTICVTDAIDKIKDIFDSGAYDALRLKVETWEDGNFIGIFYGDDIRRIFVR